MRVEYESYEDDYHEDASIAVYLDDGTEVGRYCVVDSPEQERRLMVEMLEAVIGEAVRRDRHRIAAMARNCDHSCVTRGHCDFLHAAHERLAKRIEELP